MSERTWDESTDGRPPVAVERRDHFISEHLLVTDDQGEWYATRGEDGVTLRHALVGRSARRQAADQAVSAAALDDQRAEDLANAVRLQAQIDAAQKLSAELPEAEADAQRLQAELDEIKAQLASASG